MSRFMQVYVHPHSGVYFVCIAQLSLLKALIRPHLDCECVTCDPHLTSPSKEHACCQKFSEVHLPGLLKKIECSMRLSAECLEH